MEETSLNLGGNHRRIEEPQDAVGFHARGNRHSRNGAYERAIEDYSRALELDGAFDEAYFDRGCSFYELGIYEESLADLGRAIELNSEAALYYAQRSLVYIFTDRLDLAQADQEMSDSLRNQGLE